MKKFELVSLVALLALLAGPTTAADVAAVTSALNGQKLDSGLGELPHYRFWADKSGRNVSANRFAGEKLDSGLGDIAPFSLGKNGVSGDVNVAQIR
jgi:hypothetical protein